MKNHKKFQKWKFWFWFFFQISLENHWIHGHSIADSKYPTKEPNKHAVICAKVMDALHNAYSVLIWYLWYARVIAGSMTWLFCLMTLINIWHFYDRVRSWKAQSICCITHNVKYVHVKKISISSTQNADLYNVLISHWTKSMIFGQFFVKLLHSKGT